MYVGELCKNVRSIAEVQNSKFEDLCGLGKDISQWIILSLQFLPELLFFTVTINEPRGQRPWNAIHRTRVMSVNFSQSFPILLLPPFST